MKLTLLLGVAIAALSACQAAPKRGAYTLTNRIDVLVPAGAQDVQVWIALPQDGPHQDVSGLKIDCPFPNRITTDSAGNRVLYVQASAPKEAAFTIETSFDLTREEDRRELFPNKTRPLDDDERKRFEKELSGNANVVLSQEVRDLSARIVGGETNPVLAAHKLYDWMLRNIDYWVKSPATKQASPVGSSEYCLATKTGNSTDFHALYAALLRSAGIPARIDYGSLLKQELDGQDVDQSYHCWIEFWAPGYGWIPVDAAVADIFVGDFDVTPANDELVRRATAAGYRGPDPALVQYYFGNVEERRVLWSVGRDLTLDPLPAAGALNALPKAYVEIDGQPAPERTGWTRKLTYVQLL